MVTLGLFVLLAACAPVTPTVVPSVTPTVVPTTVPITSTPLPAETPDATPTLELACVPNSYAVLEMDTLLYTGSDLLFSVKDLYHSVSATHWTAVHLPAGEKVLFLPGRTDDARSVVTAECARYEGWIPIFVLPADCR